MGLRKENTKNLGDLRLLIESLSLVNRGKLQTVSITQVICSNEAVEMKYFDRQNNELFEQKISRLSSIQV